MNHEKRCLHSLSLGDISGEAHDLWVKKAINKDGYFKVEIHNENGNIIVDELINEDCAEELAVFCRQYLRDYQECV